MSEGLEQSGLREGYKEVQFGPKTLIVPTDWSTERFGSVFDRRRESIDDLEDETIKYVGLKNLDSGQLTINGFDKDGRDRSSSRVFREGDVLFGKLRPNLNKAAIAPFSGVCSSDIIPIYAEKDAHQQYLPYLMHSKLVRDRVVSTMEGTNLPRTSWDDLEKTLIPLPPLPEQRRIADVLSTVDERIQQTEAVIEKMQELREGISQDVFQEGYFEHSGKKETRIGPIKHLCPSDWDEVKLSDITEEITEIDHNMPEKTENGVPFLTAGDVTGEWPPDFSTVERIPDEEYERLKKGFYPEVGDIVYSRFGSGSIGVARKVDFTQPFIASYSVALIKPKNKINADYLVNLMNYSKFRQAANQLAVGAANTNLNLKEIRDLQLFLPQQREQDRIGDLMATINKRISEEKSALSSFQDLKRGLMQDLLIGKVRVNTD